jgi:hypothetical protein
MSAFDLFVQAAIVILGGIAIYLLASKRGRVRRWGYVAGLASEPFWIWSAYFADQWGVIALALWWSGFYAVGAVNNWRIE